MTATRYSFTLESWQDFATVWDEETGRAAATLRRPYATRMAQHAVPMGDKWTLWGTDGALIMSRNLRPTRAAVARAIAARRAELEGAQSVEAPAVEASPAPAVEASPAPAVLPVPMTIEAAQRAHLDAMERCADAIDSTDWIDDAADSRGFFESPDL
jgi:hypothetical protein